MPDLIETVPGISEPFNGPEPEPTAQPFDMGSAPLNPEEQYRQRLETVFAPVPVSGGAAELDVPDNYYDHLVNSTEPITTTVEDAAVRDGGMLKVTPETEADAESALATALRHDHMLSEVIRGYANTKGVKMGKDLVTALREDPELRVSVGSLFLDKIGIRLHNMPSEIQANRQIKKPAIPGYEDRFLNNREYAALLALSMIDGTYDKGRVTEAIHLNSDGSVRDGQHRWAAEDLLFR